MQSDHLHTPFVAKFWSRPEDDNSITLGQSYDRSLKSETPHDASARLGVSHAAPMPDCHPNTVTQGSEKSHAVNEASQWDPHMSSDLHIESEGESYHEGSPLMSFNTSQEAHGKALPAMQVAFPTETLHLSFSDLEHHKDSLLEWNEDCT